MQSPWRVACVRIPRFPIGAVAGSGWRGAGRETAEAQLELPMSTAAATTASLPNDRPVGDGREGARPSPPGPLHWDERPIALADEGRLRAVTAAAGRARVRAGMTPAEARAICAALEIVAWDEVVLEGAITRATAAFLIASPQVTPVAGAPGMWWVGAGGLDGIGGERSLVRTLVRVAQLWHPRPRVAVASSCVAARAATWGDVGEGVARRAYPNRAHPHRGPAGSGEDDDAAALAFIVPRGGCAAYLAPAPLSFVPMDSELRSSLAALGLRTVGAFAALEIAEVERRWGRDGIAAWRLASGEDPRRPVLTRADAERCVSVELATPAASMEPVLFLVRAALDRLVCGLIEDGRAAAAVAITLTLDDGRGALPSGGVPHTITREVRPARALARVAPLFERCRSLLDRWTLSAPVCGVAVTITATGPLGGEQGSLLDAAWRDPAAAEAALERLRAELGPNVVVRPVARDAHRPEGAGGWVDFSDLAGEAERGGPPPTTRIPGRASSGPTTPPPARPESRAPNADSSGAAVPGAAVSGADSSGDGGSSDYAALRLLEAPEAVAVECEGETPAAMEWRGRRVAFARAEGPERLSGEWWKEGFRRDYWRCESEGSEFLIFLERPAGGGSGAPPVATRWCLQGWYD